MLTLAATYRSNRDLTETGSAKLYFPDNAEKTYDRSLYFSEQTLMKEKLFQITDLMIRTPGYPSNWTSQNVKIIGFSSEDHILQKNKIESFLNMSNDSIKKS